MPALGALILPALGLIWEIVKAIFFSKGDDSGHEAIDAALEKFRKKQESIRVGIKKSQDTEGDTSAIEDEINHRG